MLTLSAVLRSLIIRLAFCSQDEHKRETIEPWLGTLRLRCVDCGHVEAMGTVHANGSNRRVRV